MAYRVVITRPLLPSAMSRLDELGYELVLCTTSGIVSPDELSAAVRGADALICTLRERVDASVITAGADTLKVVSNVAVGVDNIDVDAARRLGVVVCNTPGVLDAATSDLAMLLLLAVCRRLVEMSDLLRAGDWTGFDLADSLGRDLCGMRLGIVGFGRIGRRLAERAEAFEMQVRHHARHDTGLTGYVADLDELLGSSDAVSLHVPLTAETHHLIDARRLAVVPKGALLVNTARGAVVDEVALVEALESGHLGGAGLDVFEDEPHVHPGLLAAPNVVLTPHVGSATYETRSAMCDMAVDAVVEVLAGRPYPHVVGGAPILGAD